MLPKYHIILGLVFSIILILIFPQIGILGFLIIFLSSVLIDVDHYLSFAYNKKDFSLSKSYVWHLEQKKLESAKVKKGIREKGFFHPLHTIEFLILLAILSFFSQITFFIFIGILFHSLNDFIDLVNTDRLYHRWFFLTEYLIKKLK